MSAPPTLHPSDRTLRAYGHGKLDESSSGSIDAHLEGCPDCRRRVAEVSTDSFLGGLREAGAGSPSPAAGVSMADGLSLLDSGSAMPAPPPASTLPPGLADHPDYEIVRELGRGGMGVVYLAQNRLMGRMEVLKVVGGHLISKPAVLERFLREIRSAARLHHPNIVTAYAAMRLGESLVLAMEYVEGLDLSRFVKARGSMPVANACHSIHQAALGLQHAHEHGMVHRDIKPANLMLARSGKKAVVKVLDFGLAKVTSEGQADSDLTREGQMLGTPDYIAPEQIRDAQSADIRADIYSLGCTLYYLLSGGPPFTGPNLWDVYQAHFSMEASPLNLSRPEVPVELAALVAKMMAKNPERRFQEPKEVAQALSPYFKQATSRLPAPEAGMARTQPQSPTSQGDAIAPTTAPRTRPARIEGDGVAWESLIEIKEENNLIERPEPEPAVLAPAPNGDPGRRPTWVWPAVAAGVLLFGLSFLLTLIILRIRTQAGDIVFADLPHGAQVTIDEREVKVEWPGGKGPARVTVPAGEHQVRVEMEGMIAQAEEVKIAAGQQRWIMVHLEPIVTGWKRKAEKAPDGTRPLGAGTTPLALGELFETSDPTKARIVSGTWILEGDELVQSEARGRSTILFGDRDWSDYDLEVETKIVDDNNHKDNHGVSIVFHWRGNKNFCLFRVGTYENNYIELFSNIDGKNPDGGTSRANMIRQSTPIDAWQKILLRVRRGQIECYLNSQMKFDQSYPLFVKGRIGLMTEGNRARFRRVKVVAPSGKVLFDGLPKIEPFDPTFVGAFTPASGAKETYPHPRSGAVASEPAGAEAEIRPLDAGNLAAWHGLIRNDPLDPNQVFKFDGAELKWAGKGGRIFLIDLFKSFTFKFQYCVPLDGRNGTTFCPLRLANDRPYRFNKVSFPVDEVLFTLTDGRLSKTGDVLCKDAKTGGTGQDIQARMEDASRETGSWNDVEIRCQGRELAFFLNGRLVNQLWADRPIVCHPGLNSWDADIRFRNVQITPLMDGGHARTDGDRGGKAFIPLFNGRDLDGWERFVRNGSEWKVVGGILEGRGSGQPAGYASLVSQRHDFMNYRLRTRFRHQEEGVSLVELRLSGGGENRSGYLVNQGSWPRTDLWQIPVGSVTKMRKQPFHHIFWERQAKAFPVPVKNWNTLDITALRGRITTSVNGKKVADYMDVSGSYGSGAIGIIVPIASVVQFKEIAIEEIHVGQDSGKQ